MRRHRPGGPAHSGATRRRRQEAGQVGAVACLRKTDWLFPEYRELGAFLVRGIPPGLGEDLVTVAFLGDGATSVGDVHEALNFAAVFAMPRVFFVQNNQWAISMPIYKRQPRKRPNLSAKSKI